jgi:Ring finger domain
MHSTDDVVIVSPDATLPEPSDCKDAVIDACVTDEVVSFSDEDQDISITHCAICYEALHEGDEITTSNCFKTFHRQCIMEWLMQHDLCPYCRNPFKNICEEAKTVDYFANMDCESSSDFERRNPFRLEDVDVRTETG